jgi:hypothetical protein
METLLIYESMISKFKFWSGGLQTGMRFRLELFRLDEQFHSHQRQQAFDRAWLITQRGEKVVMTSSNAGYTLWVCLRSSLSPELDLHLDHQMLAFSH